jgi:preprotein translocase subunit SecF
MDFKEKWFYWYEHKYKLLMIIPFLLVFLALIQIGVQYSVTGDFVHKGITLKGGSTITISSDGVDAAKLEKVLQAQFPSEDVAVRTITSTGKVVGLAIDSDAQETTAINALVSALKKEVVLNQGDYSIEIVGSSLGESFFKQTAMALLVAFLLMGIVVVLYFRLMIPSLAVILAAFSDITVTLALFNLTGVKLSTAGVAAFLMLVGFSVDTDVLLTTRVLKRKDGSVMDRIYGAVRTGITMTTTTLAAVLVVLIFVNSDVIKQIMLILFIGLLVDMVMTWIQNVGILRLYLEMKKK